MENCQVQHSPHTHTYNNYEATYIFCFIRHFYIHFLSHYIHFFFSLSNPHTYCPGNSTSGLGGLSFQEVPALMLQMLACIGNEYDIFPKDFRVDCSIEDVRTIVLRCGYRGLNFFYNLRRSTFTSLQLQQLQDAVDSLQYDFLMLFRVKQELLGKTKNYGGKNRMYYSKNRMCFTKNRLLKKTVCIVLKTVYGLPKTVS